MSLDQREDQCRVVSMLPTAGAIAAGTPDVGEADVVGVDEAVEAHAPIVEISLMARAKVPQLPTGVVDEAADLSGDATTMVVGPLAAAPPTAPAALPEIGMVTTEGRGSKAAGVPAVGITGATTAVPEEGSVVEVDAAEDVGEERWGEVVVAVAAAVPGGTRMAETEVILDPLEM